MIGVAGVEIAVQHTGARQLQHALCALMHPQSRCEAAAEFGLETKTPDRDHVDRIGIVGISRFEQIRAHRHRGGGSDQAQAGNLARMPRGCFERNQRAHGMTDQLCLRYTGGIEQRRSPVGHVGDGRQRCTRRAAMAGQIRRQYGIAMMGEPPAVQRPGRMIEARAVQHHDCGQRRIERPATGGNEYINTFHG